MMDIVFTEFTSFTSNFLDNNLTGVEDSFLMLMTTLANDQINICERKQRTRKNNQQMAMILVTVLST
jgi:hypothetical protein